MENIEWILASSSPRRIEIMRSHEIEPLILPPHVDERIPPDLNPHEAVMYLALKKALAVEKIYMNQLHKPERKDIHTLIVAADTIVYKDRIIGKPIDIQDAITILKALRNSEHDVITGVALIEAGKTKRRVFYEKTKVFFKDYTEKEMRAYIDTGEPWDKAGGYAIQGAFGQYVDHYDGDLNNVIGFPWMRIQKELFSFL